MQIKTTMRYHYTPTRMAIIKKNDKFGKNVTHWNRHTLLVGMKNGAAILKNSVAVSSKAKHKLTIQPSNLILRYLFKRSENICPHKDVYVNAHSNTVRNRPQTRNNPNVHQLVNG